MMDGAEFRHDPLEQPAAPFWSHVPHGCQAVEKYPNEQSDAGIRFSISWRSLSHCLSNRLPSRPALHCDSVASPAAADVMMNPVFLTVRRMSCLPSLAGPIRDELIYPRIN
jgi:hypothetical protein